MRRTYRYDPDADMVYEVGSNYFEERSQGPAVISDDVGAGVNGLRHMPSGKMLDSKSEHRKETKARGLEEVGNERNFAGQKINPGYSDYFQMTRDAAQQIQGNWNGTADWLQRQKEQG